MACGRATARTSGDGSTRTVSASCTCPPCLMKTGAGKRYPPIAEAMYLEIHGERNIGVAPSAKDRAPPRGGPPSGTMLSGVVTHTHLTQWGLPPVEVGSMPPRPCLDCGVLSKGSRCPTHTASRAQARELVRGSSAARGYGPEHRARRAALLPHAYGQPCPRCGAPMLHGEALDLDHVVPIAHGGRDGESVIAHAYCNRASGARVRRR